VNGAGADLLAQLRGYHLPTPVSWWPPAPGWWVLAGLVFAGIAGALWLVAHRRRRRAVAHRAQLELQALLDAFHQDADAAAFARGLSRLLRRFALTRFPRTAVAGLAGADWLAFLDAHGGGGRFAVGPGRVLAEAPYRPASEIPADDLARLAGDWIARNAEARA
jgi:hypothetical protein